MPAGNNSEHRNSYRTHTNDDDSKQTEHEAEDKAEHKNGDKVHHQPASNGDGKSVDHFTKFSTELKGINDQAAAVFDPKGNIADYPPETRKEFVNAYVSTFNATFNTDSREQLNERWEAAREVSHNLFKPLYQEVETKQALSHLDFSDETAKALTEHQVDTVRYITNTPRADGTTVDYKDVKEIEFTVSSIEEATKIMEASGGQAYIVDPAALDHRREEFYLLLYGSSADNDTASNYISRVLEDAISYTTGYMLRAGGYDKSGAPGASQRDFPKDIVAVADQVNWSLQQVSERTAELLAEADHAEPAEAAEAVDVEMLQAAVSQIRSHLEQQRDLHGQAISAGRHRRPALRRWALSSWRSNWETNRAQIGGHWTRWLTPARPPLPYQRAYWGNWACDQYPPKGSDSPKVRGGNCRWITPG